VDCEVLYETIEKIIPYRRIGFQLYQQLYIFKKTQGLLRRSMSIATRDKKHPSKTFN